jgi:hypothetical protein
VGWMSLPPLRMLKMNLELKVRKFALQEDVVDVLSE